MKLAFVFSEGRQERLASVQSGAGPTDFFYGAIELQREGHEVDCLEIPHLQADRLWQWINAQFGSWFPARFRLANFFAARRLVTKLNGYDAVLASNSQAGMSLGALRALGLLHAPVVAIHCGMVNWKHSPWRQKVSRALFAQQDVVLFAEAEEFAMQEVFSLPSSRLHVVPYGVDLDFWRPTHAEKHFIFAVGNDGRRDFDTFVEASRSVNYPHRLLSRLPLKSAPPAHFEVINGHWKKSQVDDALLREWYHQSLCVVVPLHDSPQPSGQSVALQAMACGRPVILSRTEGYWLHPDFRDGEHVLLIPPGSPSALADALNRLASDPALADRIGQAGREMMLRHYSIKRFAAGVLAACQHAVQK